MNLPARTTRKEERKRTSSPAKHKPRQKREKRNFLLCLTKTQNQNQKTRQRTTSLSPCETKQERKRGREPPFLRCRLEQGGRERGNPPWTARDPRCHPSAGSVERNQDWERILSSNFK
ncbi:hypothetical protein V8G54_019067, partial [Vigna mungo]